MNITYLSSVGKGKYLIERLPLGKSARSRVIHMGITPKSKIEVLNNQEHFPILIRVKRSDISIGRGLALQILVSEIE